MSEYIARLRERVGHELLLLASVAVLVRDDRGALLLMSSADTGLWQTIGGAVDPDESPASAARREALEEAGIDVELRGIVAVLGGPQYRWTYPNGDQTAYVTIVYDAAVAAGTPLADGDEALDVRWWSVDELGECEMNDFTRSLLFEAGVTGTP